MVDFGFTRNEAGIQDQIQNATNGIGADAVIIAAATDSLDPINFAGEIARKKGKVVVLGANDGVVIFYNDHTYAQLWIWYVLYDHISRA